jgi:hypothetical protein
MQYALHSTNFLNFWLEILIQIMYFLGINTENTLGVH